MLTHARGDASIFTAPATAIVHVVNDVGAWGAGFTRSLDRYPGAKRSYLRWKQRTGLSLGAIHAVPIFPEHRQYLIHVCAQHGLPSRANPHPFDLRALRTALPQIDHVCRLLAVSRVQMPHIGCGYGGASWDEVEAELKAGLTIDVTVLSL